MERIGAFMVRHPWAVTLPLAAIGLTLIGMGVYNYVTLQSASDRIVRIESSPCQVNAAGRECAALRAEIAKKEPLRVPCTSFQRIVRPRTVYRRFTRCGDSHRKAKDVRTTSVRPSSEPRAQQGSAPEPVTPEPAPGDSPAPPSGSGNPPSPPPPDPAPPASPPPSNPPVSPPADPLGQVTQALCTQVNALGIQVQVAC